MVGPAWEVQKELTKMPNLTKPTGEFAQEIKSISDFKKLALMVLGAAAKMQMDGALNLKEEQEILMNGADLLIEIFNAESLLLRIRRLHGTPRLASDKVYQAILQTHFHDTNARMAKISTDALASFCSGDLLKTLLLGVKRFASYPVVNVKSTRRLIANHLIDNNGYAL